MTALLTRTLDCNHCGRMREGGGEGRRGRGGGGGLDAGELRPLPAVKTVLSWHPPLPDRTSTD